MPEFTYVPKREHTIDQDFGIEAGKIADLPLSTLAANHKEKQETGKNILDQFDKTLKDLNLPSDYTIGNSYGLPDYRFKLDDESKLLINAIGELYTSGKNKISMMDIAGANSDLMQLRSVLQAPKLKDAISRFNKVAKVGEQYSKLNANENEDASIALAEKELFGGELPDNLEKAQNINEVEVINKVAAGLGKNQIKFDSKRLSEDLYFNVGSSGHFNFSLDEKIATSQKKILAYQALGFDIVPLKDGKKLTQENIANGQFKVVPVDENNELLISARRKGKIEFYKQLASNKDLKTQKEKFDYLMSEEGKKELSDNIEGIISQYVNQVFNKIPTIIHQSSTTSLTPIGTAALKPKEEKEFKDSPFSVGTDKLESSFLNFYEKDGKTIAPLSKIHTTEGWKKLSDPQKKIAIETIETKVRNELIKKIKYGIDSGTIDYSQYLQFYDEKYADIDAINKEFFEILKNYKELNKDYAKDRFEAIKTREEFYSIKGLTNPKLVMLEFLQIEESRRFWRRGEFDKGKLEVKELESKFGKIIYKNFNFNAYFDNIRIMNQDGTLNEFPFNYLIENERFSPENSNEYQSRNLSFSINKDIGEGKKYISTLRGFTSELISKKINQGNSSKTIFEIKSLDPNSNFSLQDISNLSGDALENVIKANNKIMNNFNYLLSKDVSNMRILRNSNSSSSSYNMDQYPYYIEAQVGDRSLKAWISSEDTESISKIKQFLHKSVEEQLNNPKLTLSEKRELQTFINYDNYISNENSKSYLDTKRIISQKVDYFQNVLINNKNVKIKYNEKDSTYTIKYETQDDKNKKHEKEVSLKVDNYSDYSVIISNIYNLINN